LATSHTPIIVMGSQNTSAASFMRRFGTGVVCDYKPESFAQAVDYLKQPNIQVTIRQKAAQIGPKFSDSQIGEWVWQSLASGQPFDHRFEELFETGD